MPHIHTEPGQHDITASALIVRMVDDEPRVLVHMHRKHGKLMQLGGHVEIDETPWQTLGHELKEEGGYDIADLKVLQPFERPLEVRGAVVHPVPVLSNTHSVNQDHYHSDYCYAFVADKLPTSSPAEGESTDLRWLTLHELGVAATAGIALNDVVDIYAFVINQCLPNYHQIDASVFSLSKPNSSLLKP